MKVSYSWLQTFFEEKLPPAEKVAELLTMHAFEVESVEAITRASGADWTLDVKVLPNRTHDCLSHRGVARELGAILDVRAADQAVLPVALPRIAVGKPQHALALDIREPKRCRRYMGRVIEQVQVGASPGWLADALTTIGQKSINNVVDAANFVMFHLGQPLHAFDADRVAGGAGAAAITVRLAEEGEQMATLDSKELTFTPEDLLITDGTRPLAVAGIKGGKQDLVDEHTTTLYLEAANFAPTHIRRTAQRLGIRTDSSQRYENDLSPELTAEAMDLFTKLILAMAKSEKTKVGPVIDWYPRPRKPYVIGFRTADVKNVLGVEIPDAEIGNMLTRLQLPWKKVQPLEQVLKQAPGLTGLPYVYGSQISYDAPENFDCSSLTAYLYAQAGVAIPRITIDQYFFGAPVDIKEVAPGDIVFSNTHTGGNVYFYSQEYMPGRKVKEGIDHCGLYLGKGKILHTSRHLKNVETTIEPLKDNPLFADAVGIRRMVTDSDERFVVTVPDLRLDLRRKEDVIEEIGRLWGYDKLVPVQPREVVAAPLANPLLTLTDQLRTALTGAGFSEVYLYSLVNEGELRLANPLASDQAFLRCSLMPGVKHALEENLKYLDEVKIFEIGQAFLGATADSDVAGETTRLAIGIGTKRKLKPNELFFELKGVMELLAETLHLPLTVGEDLFVRSGPPAGEAGETRVGWIGPDGIAEFHLDQLLAYTPNQVRYTPIVRFPSITRDIALFVSSDTKVGEVLNTILEAAGPLVVRSHLFDIFEKEGKKSLAFRLVFQAKDRTLQDSEANTAMEAVAKAVTEKGWTVR